jgi:hypothetical protein
MKRPLNGARRKRISVGLEEITIETCRLHAASPGVAVAAVPGALAPAGFIDNVHAMKALHGRRLYPQVGGKSMID